MNINTFLLEEAQNYMAPLQVELLEDLGRLSQIINGSNFHDYSFIIDPLSKAYEGFLKDFFLKINLINQSQYQSDRFRVGKVLNPSLRYKRFSVFQKLADISPQGEELAETLWTAWKHGRNKVFHYFPGETENIKKEEAIDKINGLLQAIVTAGKFLKDNQNYKY